MESELARALDSFAKRWDCNRLGFEYSALRNSQGKYVLYKKQTNICNSSFFNCSKSKKTRRKES